MNKCLFLMILLYGSIFQSAQHDPYLKERVRWFVRVLKENRPSCSIDYYRLIYQQSPFLVHAKRERKSMLQISEEAGNDKATRAILDMLV